MEAFAEAKDYVEFPEEDEDKALKEDVNVNIEVKNYDEDAETEIEVKSDEDKGEVEVEEKAEEPAKVEEPFEYFTDFDEPTPKDADEDEKIDLQEAFNLFN